MPRGEVTVSAGTRSVAPTTIGRLPVYITGAPAPEISESVYGQADAGRHIIVGLNAGINAGQAALASATAIGQDASAWGDGAIAIGEGAIVGQVAAKDGGIAIGHGCTSNGKSAVRIGSQLAFGAGAGDDAIILGTQAQCAGNAGIAIGRGSIATQNAVAIGHTASTNGTTEGIAVGHSATAMNTGVNHFGIAIGVGAQAGTNNGHSAVAIGHNAVASHALASKLIAIGDGATINANVTQAIAIGAGATNPGSNEVVFGDSANVNYIRLFTIRTLAANPVRHRVGASGGWAIRDLADANDIFEVDTSGTAGDIRLRVWDVTAGALKRVTMGANDSGGAGFRYLRVPN